MTRSYALYDLDIKMLKYLNYENGFFIEAGANDGLSQSNTALYEFSKGWKGLLVEPNKIKSDQCKANRPNSIVENYALVSKNYDGRTIRGNFHTSGYADSLTAMVCDDGDYDDEILSGHKKRILNDGNFIEVPSTTMDSLLSKHNITSIDFFSLDVEGYEISVLNGMDLSFYRPKYFLIEMNYDERKTSTIKYMESKNYKSLEYLTQNDCVFIDGNL